MMLSDEPYRWADAVANRRDYIEDQLRTGSPVVGLGFEDGVLLVTLGRGQQKLFEVYDRIALAAIGHSTDIEKLRQGALDMAHTIGFSYSEEDVTLRQIVYFGLGPAMKAGFDDIIRSPFLVRILLAELDGQEGAHVFYTVDYDGAFFRGKGFAAVGGSSEIDRLMAKPLSACDFATLSLGDALKAALQSWAIGRWAGLLEEMPEEADALDKMADEVQTEDVLKRELQNLSVEAVVLQRSRSGKTKYRLVTADEIAPVLDSPVD